MSRVQEKIVSEDEAEMRLDRWFKLYFPQINHGMLEKFLRKGYIRVGGKRAKSNQRLEAGQKIRIPPLRDREEAGAPDTQVYKPQSQNSRNLARDREFLHELIIYEDDEILALNKPHGLAVQGGTNTKRHIDGMLGALADRGEKPRLVHRLDRDTSGLLLLAKTRLAAARLGEAFRQHRIEKTYWALTAGLPHPREGTINQSIGKRMVSQTLGDDVTEPAREIMLPVSDEDAKTAITDFQTVDDAGGRVGFIALRPRTGRTHQLRVHCQIANMPIIGDGKYGGAQAKMVGLPNKLHLFCRTMRFEHPKTKKMMVLNADLSGHMLKSWSFFTFNQQTDVFWPENI